MTATNRSWELAQVNIALPKEPLTSALLADFVWPPVDEQVEAILWPWREALCADRT